MNKLFLTLLLAAGLGACASQQRTEPPAPVVSSGSAPHAEAVPEQATPSPPDETVEVYAYRPPSSAPDAPAPPGGVSVEGALPADGSLISESAKTGSPRATPAEGAKTPAAGGTAAPAEQVVAYAPPAPSAANLPPAADALFKQADQQRQAKDYVGAAATLERALGIQPQDPYIWNRLARVRVEQGLYAQAGNLASRSNALAGNRVSLKQDNWRIIGAARRSAGDTAGAMEAEQKARGG